MLDQNVKFEDVSAETIAMEDVQFEDVDQFTLDMEHWDDMKAELKVDSIWSIYDGGRMPADKAIFSKKMRKVTYEFVRPDATVEELEADLRDGGKRASAEVSSWAIDGTVKSLWYAADSCISQSGTHHMYIEDFKIQEDGSVSLTTGS
jgi:hypothetical protein